MKNFIKYAFAAILCVSLLSACKKDEAQEADTRIEKAVTGLSLPQKLNDGVTTLTDCYYSDKVLVFRNEVPKEKLAALDVDASRTKTLENLKGGLLPRNLVQNLIKADASVKYIMVCGNDSVSYTFTAAELK